MKSGLFKLRIWLMLGLSLLAVGVTSLSTMAWFQLQLGSETVSGANTVAGSPNINIRRIKGYKFEYGETSQRTVDYASGDVTSVTTFDTIGQADVSEEMETIKFDIPTDGTGYYLIGDANFVKDNYPDKTPYSDFVDKFDASLKLTRKDIRSTMYYRKNINVSTDGEKVRIKNHYFDGSAKTKNEYVTGFTFNGGGVATSDTTTVTGATTITFTNAGTYNIWFETNLNKLSVEEALDVTAKNRPVAARKGACDPNGDTSKIYFKASNAGWWEDGAKFKFNFFNDSGNHFLGANWGTLIGSNESYTKEYWECSIWDGATHVQVCRMSSNGYDQKNYSGNFAIEAGRAFYFDDRNNGTTSSHWFDYWVDGFYVVGSGGVFGNSYQWHASTGFYIPSITSDTYSNGTEITFSGDEYWALVYRRNNTDYSNSTSYPDKRGFRSGMSNDMSVIEDGTNYQVHNTSGYTATIYRIKDGQSNAGEIYISKGYAVTLTPSYFLASGDGGGRLDLSGVSYTYGGTIVTAKSETIPMGASFSTAQTFNVCQYWDTTNAIWYVFKREGATWYTDPRCRAEDAYSDAVIDRELPLYAKMVAKPLKTFYVDVKDVSWSNCRIGTRDLQDSALVASGKGTEGLSLPKASNIGGKEIIAGALYRFTIPSTAVSGNNDTVDKLGFLIHNGGSGTGDQTTDVYEFGSSGYLRVHTSTGTGSHRNWYYDDDFTEVHGSVYISRASNSYATQEILKMGYAATANHVALEEGVILYAGDVIAVNYTYTSGNNTWYWHNTLEATDNENKYAKGGVSGVKTFTDAGSHSTSEVIQIKKTGRYTVYLMDSNRHVALAQVPLDGNGYYIMTSSTNQSETFDNAHKFKVFDGDSKNKAFLKNLYIEESCYVYIRSYNDNVDLGPGSSSSGDDQYRYWGHLGTSGSDTSVVQITISDPGYYNVYLYYPDGYTHIEKNLRFSIVETDERLTFFNLNSLSSHDGIEASNTSIIMETSFQVISVDPTSISLIVKNSFANIGTYAICTSERIKDPYTYMRQRVYGYDKNKDGDYVDSGDIAPNTYAPVNGDCTHNIAGFSTTAGNPDKIYYLYIFIDYTSTSITISPTGSFSFYLKSTQVVA